MNLIKRIKERIQYNRDVKAFYATKRAFDNVDKNDPESVAAAEKIWDENLEAMKRMTDYMLAHKNW